MLDFDLSNRVAKVTGGSDSVGTGIELVRADARAHIVITARRQAEIGGGPKPRLM